MSNKNEKLAKSAEQNIEDSKELKLLEEELDNIVGGTPDISLDDPSTGNYYRCDSPKVDNETFRQVFYNQANTCPGYLSKLPKLPSGFEKISNDDINGAHCNICINRKYTGVGRTRT